MAGRLGRRVVHFLNLPIKLQLPENLTNLTEFSLKTIPSATKIEIKRVLESLYGFQVAKVQTLNMEGKKKKRGGLLIAKPDYKKAYVTLRSPLSISGDLFPIRVIEEEKSRSVGKERGTSFVEDGDEGRKRHWLEGEDRKGGAEIGKGKKREDGNVKVKFPWSSMRGVGIGGRKK